MPQAPFPDSGPDDTDTEPDTEPDSDAPGPEQGLFITLPAEELTLSGFAQNGQADTMAPGALLATIVDTVTARTAPGWRAAPMTSYSASSPAPGARNAATRGSY